MGSVIQTKSISRKNGILIWTWVDLASFILCWILAGLIISLFFSEIMPSAFSYSALSRDAIASGEGVVLLQYYIFGIFLVIAILTHFGLSTIVCHFLIKTYKTKDKRDIDNRHLLINQIFFWSMLVSYLVLPVASYFYFWKKGYFENLKNKNAKQIIYQNKKGQFQSLVLLISIFLVIVVNTIFIGLPTAIPLLIQTASYYNPSNVQKFYTFSNNHDNVLYLYFDRTDSWRIKNTVENNHELQNKFQDFTFYENNLSLSDTTISSIPSMLFGYNADIVHKELNPAPIKEIQVKSLDDDNVWVTFPGSDNRRVSDLTMEQYYKYSFANFIAFWNYLGYKITNLCQFTSYGKQSPLIFQANNAQQMNDELRNTFGFEDFTGVNSSELQRYHHRKVYWNNMDDAETLLNLPNNFNFTNTNNKVFCGIFSQQTHWNVASKNKNTGQYQILVGNTPENIDCGVKDALIDTSVLIEKLKNEPFYEKDGRIGNIYDHTTIIITSDHGQCFDNEASKSLNSPNSMQTAAGYDAVFMIKPTGQNLIRNGTNESFKIDHSLITNADHLAIIRSVLFPNHPEWINASNQIPDPLDPQYRYDNIDIIVPIKSFHNLYHNFAVANVTELWNRTVNSPIKVMHPIDWRYMWWRKRIMPAKIRQFSYVENEHRIPSIFHEIHWTDL